MILLWNSGFWQRFENFVFLELREKIYNLDYENLERETKNLLKQDWEKILIYFEKDELIIIDEKDKNSWF